MDPNSNEAAKANSNENSGASDIDFLIKEYDSGTKDVTTETKHTTEKSGEMNEVLSYIRQSQQRETEAAINNTVKAVKGELNIGDDVVRGFIEVQAAKDKSLQKAFAERISDPQGWEKYQKRLGDDFMKQFPAVDSKATNDTNELLSAVQSSKQSDNVGSDETPNYETMDDSEFRKALQGIK